MRSRTQAGFKLELGIRWQMILSYLFVIWVTTALLIFFLGRSFEESSIGARRSSLYAQAHLLAAAVRARGGPSEARLTALGGVPFKGRVLLLDGSGRVLEDSAADPEFFGKTITAPEVQTALSGKEASNTYYLPDGSFVMYAAVPSDWGGRGAVFISQDLSDIVAQYKSIMGMALWGGIITSLLACAIGVGLSSVLSTPLSEMARSARAMASGRLDVRVEPKGPYEVRVLGKAFNDMAQSIENTVRAQEAFLTAAAHELRGPLSSTTVLLESMEMSPPKSHELPGLLSDLNQELSRLSRVSENILELLRVKNVEYAQEEVDPLAVIEEALDARKPLIESKQLKVKVQVAPHLGAGLDAASNVKIDGSCSKPEAPSSKTFIKPFINNRALFGLIVSNLVDNAVKFTPGGGEILIQFLAEGGQFVLKVKDTGPGIPDDKVPMIFERFYQVDLSRKKGWVQSGSGLGLSIVEEACKRTGGKIQVETEEGKGSVFTVRWPL